MENNNNNQEINFEKFYENMLVSLKSLNHEINLKESELNSSSFNLTESKICKTCASMAAIVFSPTIFVLIDNNLPLVSILLLILVAVIEALHEYCLNQTKENLQLQLELQAKIAEKEALITICNSFGIEVPESLEDNKRGR